MCFFFISASNCLWVKHSIAAHGLNSLKNHNWPKCAAIDSSMSIYPYDSYFFHLSWLNVPLNHKLVLSVCYLLQSYWNESATIYHHAAVSIRTWIFCTKMNYTNRNFWKYLYIFFEFLHSKTLNNLHFDFGAWSRLGIWTIAYFLSPYLWKHQRKYFQKQWFNALLFIKQYQRVNYGIYYDNILQKKRIKLSTTNNASTFVKHTE